MCAAKMERRQGHCVRLPCDQTEVLARRICSLGHICDESGLFFKMLPERTLAFSAESCMGVKQSKERITVMVGANAPGTEKLPLLVIDKAKKKKNTRCFGTVKTSRVNNSNSKAWIRHSLFEEYLHQLDQKFVREKKVNFFLRQLWRTQ